MYNFKFADIGEGIHEGILLEWYVKEGDLIKNGDSLFLVETDKVNADIPSPVSGKVVKLNGTIGETIHVGDTMVVIETEGSSSDNKVEEKSPIKEEDTEAAGEKGASVVGEVTVSNDLIPSFSEDEEKPIDKDRKVLATPVARKLAKDLGVDIKKVEGSGKNGRVMKDDIRAYKEVEGKDKTHEHDLDIYNELKEVTRDQSMASITPQDLVEEVALTPLRKSIAKNMVLSKASIPHAILLDEIDVTDLVAYRKTFNSKDEERENLSYMPFIVKAVVGALRKFPIFNSSYNDMEQSILYKKFFNIGIATDTPKGLLVPVVKECDRFGILDLDSKIKDITNKARDGSASLDDLSNGTFTITNFGSTGSLLGTPIIRYPEAAILGIGKIVKKPVVDKNGRVVVRDIMGISLGIDHRIIDGADAGRFTIFLKELLEDPNLLLMS